MFTFKTSSKGGNFSATLARLNKLKQLEKLPEALEIVGEESDKRCPKLTGALVASRRNKIKGNEGSIVYEESYAVYVHERLDTHHPNGEAKFLENAWTAKKDEFMKKVLEK